MPNAYFYRIPKKDKISTKAGRDVEKRTSEDLNDRSILKPSSNKVQQDKYNLKYGKQRKQKTAAKFGAAKQQQFGPHKRFRDGAEKRNFNVLDVMKQSEESKKKSREQFSDARARDAQRSNFDRVKRTNPILAAELDIPETETNEDKEIEALLRRKVRDTEGKVIAAFTSWKEKVNEEEVVHFKCWICNAEVEGKQNLMGHTSGSRHQENCKTFGEVAPPQPLPEPSEPQEPEHDHRFDQGGWNGPRGDHRRGGSAWGDRERGDGGAGWGDRRRDVQDDGTFVHPWGTPEDLVRKQMEVLAEANRIAGNQAEPSRVRSPTQHREASIDPWEYGGDGGDSGRRLHDDRQRGFHSSFDRSRGGAGGGGFQHDFGGRPPEKRQLSPMVDDDYQADDDFVTYSPKTPPCREDFSTPGAVSSYGAGGVGGGGGGGFQLPKPVPSLPKPVPITGHQNPFRTAQQQEEEAQELFPQSPERVSPSRNEVRPPPSKRRREDDDDEVDVPPAWDADQDRIISDPHYKPRSHSLSHDPGLRSPGTGTDLLPVPAPVPAPSPETKRPTLSNSELSKLPKPMSYEDRVFNHLGTLKRKPGKEDENEPDFDIDPHKSFLDPQPSTSAPAASPARPTLHVKPASFLQEPPPPQPDVSSDFNSFLDQIIDNLAKNKKSEKPVPPPLPPSPSTMTPPPLPPGDSTSAAPPPPPPVEMDGIVQQIVSEIDSNLTQEEKLSKAREKLSGYLQVGSGSGVSGLKSLAGALRQPPPPPPPQEQRHQLQAVPKPPAPRERERGQQSQITDHDIDDFMNQWCDDRDSSRRGEPEEDEEEGQIVEPRPSLTSALAKLRARKDKRSGGGSGGGGGGGSGGGGRDQLDPQPMDLDDDECRAREDRSSDYGSPWGGPRDNPFKRQEQDGRRIFEQRGGSDVEAGRQMPCYEEGNAGRGDARVYRQRGPELDHGGFRGPERPEFDRGPEGPELDGGPFGDFRMSAGPGSRVGPVEATWPPRHYDPPDVRPERGGPPPPLFEENYAGFSRGNFPREQPCKLDRAFVSEAEGFGHFADFGGFGGDGGRGRGRGHDRGRDEGFRNFDSWNQGAAGGGGGGWGRGRF